MYEWFLYPMNFYHHFLDEPFTNGCHVQMNFTTIKLNTELNMIFCEYFYYMSQSG